MRILCLSDTHGYHERLPIDKTVDVIVHTGDFSNSYGKNNIYETEEFLSWFNSLNVKYKISSLLKLWDWKYYNWLDEYLVKLANYCDIDTFYKNIGWEKSKTILRILKTPKPDKE